MEDGSKTTNFGQRFDFVRISFRDVSDLVSCAGKACIGCVRVWSLSEVESEVDEVNIDQRVPPPERAGGTEIQTHLSCAERSPKGRHGHVMRVLVWLEVVAGGDRVRLQS